MMTRRFTECSLLQQPTRFVERIASVPVLVVLMVFSVLIPTVLFPLHGIGDIRPLDLHFTYSYLGQMRFLGRLTLCLVIRQ